MAPKRNPEKKKFSNSVNGAEVVLGGGWGDRKIRGECKDLCSSCEDSRQPWKKTLPDTVNGNNTGALKITGLFEKRLDRLRFLALFATEICISCRLLS